MHTFTKQYTTDLEDLRFVINQGEESTLLTLQLNLEARIEDYLQDSGIYDRLSDLENGVTGTLDTNLNEMNFTTLENLSIVKGIWDNVNGCVTC